MPKVSAAKLAAFQNQYNEMIGKAIVDGLLDPGQVSGLPGLGIHAEGPDYEQDGGPYSQSTGGDHTQTGGGGYTQSAPPKTM